MLCEAPVKYQPDSGPGGTTDDDNDASEEAAESQRSTYFNVLFCINFTMGIVDKSRPAKVFCAALLVFIEPCFEMESTPNANVFKISGIYLFCVNSNSKSICIKRPSIRVHLIPFESLSVSATKILQSIQLRTLPLAIRRS